MPDQGSSSFLSLGLTSSDLSSDYWGVVIHLDHESNRTTEALFDMAVLRAGRTRTVVKALVCDAPAVDPHHVQPRRLGGSDSEENLLPLCKLHHNRETGRERAADNQRSPGSSMRTNTGPVDREAGPRLY
jgi:HNH endonuclease